MDALCKGDIDGRGLCGSSGESMMDFSILFYANAINRGVVDHWSEKPVLISHIHNMNGPDGEIPSIVRLYLAKKETEKSRSGDVYLQLP
jgi:hypothetical protein